MGIVGLVGKDGLRGCVLEQGIGPLEIMGLPWREKKACRVAQCIDRGMDLVLRPPRLSPMVESIIAYSLSASCAKALNTRCQTPLLEETGLSFLVGDIVIT